MRATSESLFPLAGDGRIDGAYRSLLERVLPRLAACASLDTILITGSLARGRARAAWLEETPVLLSDVDLVAVPGPLGALRLRRAVGELLPELHESGGEDAPLVEIGVLSRARIRHPRDTLFLHDLASSGRTIHGDPFLLESLHRRLTGRRVARIEGKRLLGNRIAGLLYHLPRIGSDERVERVRVRDKLVRAHEDIVTARQIVALLPEGERRLTTDETEGSRRAREAFANEEVLLASLEISPLLRDWKATLSSLHQAWESTSVPRGGRLGAGAALGRVHSECARVARNLFGGNGASLARAGELRAAVLNWRRLLSGIDDTKEEDDEICASLLDRLG